MECNAERYHCPRNLQGKNIKYQLGMTFKDSNSSSVNVSVCFWIYPELCIIFILTQLRFQSRS